MLVNVTKHTALEDKDIDKYIYFRRFLYLRVAFTEAVDQEQPRAVRRNIIRRQWRVKQTCLI